ncbi:MAG: DUF58 domain-containing protein [Terriglobales bacterium]
METAADHPRLAWRQSLGAGLLLGLALGCAWLAHWTGSLYPRLLLWVAAGLLALLGLGLLLSLSDEPGWMGTWQSRLEAKFSGAGIPFFTALVVLLVAAITSGNNLLYLVASGLIAALLVSGFCAALNLSGMELRFHLPGEVFAATPAPVQFRLANAKSLWPAYSLTLTASAPPLPGEGAAPASLLPIYIAYLPRHGSASSSSDLTFPHRGRYGSAAFVLSTGFPFGLMRQHRRFQSHADEPELLVYPAPTAGLEVPLRQIREGALMAQPRAGDGQDLYRLRPHQPGDTARQIHWRASARAGTLVVRESNQDTGLRARLRLSLPPALAPARVEAALSLCAGWMLALERAGLALEFCGENATPAAPGLYLPPAPASRHRRAVLDYLALVDAGLPLARSPHLTPGLHEILVDAAS